MLLEVNEFVLRNFAEGSRPSRATLMRWLSKGQIPGARKVGGRWYVDESIWYAKENVAPLKSGVDYSFAERALRG